LIAVWILDERVADVDYALAPQRPRALTKNVLGRVLALEHVHEHRRERRSA